MANRRTDSYRHSGFTSDVSASGMFVATDQAVAKGSRIRVALGATHATREWADCGSYSCADP